MLDNHMVRALADGRIDVALLLGYVFGVVGFLIGLGFANYPISRLLGRPASPSQKP